MLLLRSVDTTLALEVRRTVESAPEKIHPDPKTRPRPVGVEVGQEGSGAITTVGDERVRGRTGRGGTSSRGIDSGVETVKDSEENNEWTGSGTIWSRVYEPG